MPYLRRQILGLQDPRITRPGTWGHTCVQHDLWCPRLRGECCTCDPDILFLLADGERHEVDRLGRIIPARQSPRCLHGFEKNA